MFISGTPRVVLLTKIDLLCTTVQESTSNVFSSEKVDQTVEKVSTLFGISRNNILPVRNYQSEFELENSTSILALLALRQALYFTEDYMENLKEMKNASQECVSKEVKEKE